MSERPAFKARMRARELLLGTFVKTPSAAVCEVLALSPLDCACLDAEHAPFDRGDLDACLMAFRSLDKPALVRVPSGAPAEILNALDCGATGVLIPHVRDAAQARAAVAACHYGGPAGRGYAGSTRAAHYTTRSLAEHLAASAATTTVVAQVEDAEAVAAIESIASVEGIDCIFIGRADLTVSLGAASAQDERVTAAVERIVTACAAAGRAAGLYLPSLDEAPRWIARGVSFFLVGSDHQFLLEGARAQSTAFRSPRP